MFGRGTGAIVLSYIFAMIVAVLPLYETLALWRPMFIPMVLIYWVMALPHRHGIWEAFVVGVVTDALLGTIIGQHALSFVILAYVTRMFYQRIRVSPLAKMSIAIGFMLGIVVFINVTTGRLTERVDSFAFVMLLPLFSSALIWPVMFSGLRRMRRSFGVV